MITWLEEHTDGALKILSDSRENANKQGRAVVSGSGNKSKSYYLDQLAIYVFSRNTEDPKVRAEIAQGNIGRLHRAVENGLNS